MNKKIELLELPVMEKEKEVKEKFFEEELKAIILSI